MLLAGCWVFPGQLVLILSPHLPVSGTIGDTPDGWLRNSRYVGLNTSQVNSHTSCLHYENYMLYMLKEWKFLQEVDERGEEKSWEKQREIDGRSNRWLMNGKISVSLPALELQATSRWACSKAITIRRGTSSYLHGSAFTGEEDHPISAYWGWYKQGIRILLQGRVGLCLTLPMPSAVWWGREVSRGSLPPPCLPLPRHLLNQLVCRHHPAPVAPHYHHPNSGFIPNLKKQIYQRFY